MDKSIDSEKIIYLLKEIYKKSEYNYLKDILSFSSFSFEPDFTDVYSYFDKYYLKISTQYDVYIKYYSIIENIPEIIKKDLNKISDIYVSSVRIFPDYDKIEIINSEIRPVYTSWDEINRAQNNLIDLLRKSSTSFDFQNIGNTSRTILLKLAQIVFIPEKHTPKDLKIDISEDKYKNRLHSYIKRELMGEQNNELRLFADAAINTVEKAIDLANKLTHKLEAEREIAEVCVIGTIGAISIVKLIEKNKTVD